MRCPYKECNVTFKFCDPINRPKGSTPKEGSCGMCYRCGDWWEIKDGMVIKYIPTKEQLEFMNTQRDASRKRFLELENFKSQN